MVHAVQRAEAVHSRPRVRVTTQHPNSMVQIAPVAVFKHNNVIYKHVLKMVDGVQCSGVRVVHRAVTAHKPVHVYATTRIPTTAAHRAPDRLLLHKRVTWVDVPKMVDGRIGHSGRNVVLIAMVVHSHQRARVPILHRKTAVHNVREQVQNPKVVILIRAHRMEDGPIGRSGHSAVPIVAVAHSHPHARVPTQIRSTADRTVWVTARKLKRVIPRHVHQWTVGGQTGLLNRVTTRAAVVHKY